MSYFEHVIDTLRPVIDGARAMHRECPDCVRFGICDDLFAITDQAITAAILAEDVERFLAESPEILDWPLIVETDTPRDALHQAIQARAWDQLLLVELEEAEAGR